MRVTIKSQIQFKYPTVLSVGFFMPPVSPDLIRYTPNRGAFYFYV